MLAGNLSEDEDKSRFLQKDSQISSLFKEFPTSTNILVVDTNLVTLLEMKKIMKQYAYQVSIYSEAEEAIAFLTTCKHEINIVVWDYNMPGINGLQALEIIGSKLDVPVVIMSDDDNKESLINATIQGACAYVTKPVGESVIATIWQHIVRRKMKSKPGLLPPVQSEGKDDSNKIEETQPLQSDPVPSNGLDKDNNDPIMTINQCDGEEANKKIRKPRITWGKDLQEKFLKAIDIIGGPQKANPKSVLKCLQEMKVQGLNRSNVASHLQKYRMSIENNQAPEQMPETSWSLLGLMSNIHTTTSSSLMNGDPVQQNQYPDDVHTTPSSLVNGDPVQQNQYGNNFHTTASSLINGGLVQQSQFRNNAHTTASSQLMNGEPIHQNQYRNNAHSTALSQLMNGEPVYQNQYRNYVHSTASSQLMLGEPVQQSQYQNNAHTTALSQLMNGELIQQSQYRNNVHAAASSLLNGELVHQGHYGNNVHSASSSLMNGDPVQQNQYPNNVHTTALSQLMNGEPVQQNQYRNGYLTTNNNNQVMTNPLPCLPYLDHPHLQQQHQQLQQQFPVSHISNYATSNNEPEQAFSISDPEPIYPSFPYDLEGLF